MELEAFPEDVCFKIFRTLEDPRVQRQQHHSLEAILVISICATLCDCDTWVDIADFAEDHQDWFAQFLELPYGAPSHDTFGRVFALINPILFEEVFSEWVRKTFKIQAGEVIAIDGKTMRGTQKAGKKGTGLHVVSAWASQMGVVLGQIITDEKSNEITAIPKLLDNMAIKGCTITIDAMGCQHAIVRKIKERKGEYCIAVKGNQKSLLEELQNIFSDERRFTLEKDASDGYLETLEKNHGRIERRQYYSLCSKKWLSADNRWEGCQSVHVVVSERTCHGATSKESRFYISSHLPIASINGPIIRQHWSIENNLHWALDVVFNEDHLQTKIKNAAQNLSLVKKFALNLLKKEPSFKASMRRKRKKAGRDFSYLFKVISPLL
jgi:predicted transposase YbfD/YdcC